MKKSLIRLSMVLATVLVLFASCGKEDYDEELLIGSWTTSDHFTYVFHDDYTGSRTNSKGRTLTFTWSLDGDELEIKFDDYEEGQSEIVTYKVYIIEELTETKMEAYDYDDSSKTTIIFTKKK